MKTILITALIIFTTSCNCFAQWIVHDAINEISNMMNSMQEIGVATESLQTALDAADKGSKLLEIAQKTVEDMKKVSSAVKLYKRISDILSRSVQTGNLYVKLSKALIVDGNFSDSQKSRHLASLYCMFTKTTEYILQAEDLLQDDKYKLEDASRLKFINDLYVLVNKNYGMLYQYGQRLMGTSFYKTALNNDYNLLNKYFTF